MAYSREDIVNKVNAALTNPSTLYDADFVNYRGSVDGIRYTEIAAREISRRVKTDNFSALLEIPTISRSSSYKTASHAKKATRAKPDNSGREEEWIAISMYGKIYNGIGEILDFQVPLKDAMSDSAGKIDLLSYNKAENTAYILELKKPGSNETLLRCALEAYTYWKTVDKEKLLRDFGIEGAELRKAILIFSNCVAYKDFQDDACEAVYSLMCDKLHVDLFVLNNNWSEVIDGYKH
ncbi:MAG: hypothetical protein LBS21_00495 [Clostridiales bacterium]|jgi:hypothetical protein|nr:hypothetical protein [Clostridiales bacterium]